MQQRRGARLQYLLFLLLSLSFLHSVVLYCCFVFFCFLFCFSDLLNYKFDIVEDSYSARSVNERQGDLLEDAFNFTLFFQ